MADLWADLEKAILAGDADRVVDLCLPLDEDARARLAPAADELAQEHIYPRESPVVQAAQTALLCVGPPPPTERDEQGLFRSGLFRHPAHEHLEAVVLSRPRPWRDAWARAAAAGVHWEAGPTWETLRSLVRAGACAKPTGERYVLLMMLGLRELEGGVLRAPKEVDALLRADPEALEEDLWAPFEWQSFNPADWPTWERVLVRLAADGSISRDRLIDEVLGALRRREDPGAAKGLVAFHDKLLRPTPTELAAREAEYLRWLESDRDAMVGFALGNLTRLDREIPVDGRELLDRLGPLVGMRAKTHAKRAVALAGRVVDREPALAQAGLEVLVDALAHDSAEVQEGALSVLERHADEVDRQRLAALAAAVDTALRARVERLAAVDGGAQAAAAAVPVPPASVVDPDVVPRLLPDAALAPVEDVEELLDLASRLLEGLDDADEAERFVDGLSRLCEVEPPAGRRKAVQRRARRRLDPIATLTRAWLGWDGEHPPSIGWTGPTEALGRRLTALAGRLTERRADVLLSAPTHRGGFLDPDVLAARLERAAVIEDFDLAQALLRLPAEGRAASLALIAALPEGTVPASSDTAAVLANPAEVTLEFAAPEDPWHGYSYGPAEPRSPARMLAEFEPAIAVASAEGKLEQRWLSIVWPGRREIYFGTVFRTLRSWPPHMIGTRGRQERLAVAFGIMREPDEPLGPYALVLLAIGLLEADESRLLAAEAVADAIATRRLVPAALGRAVAAEAVRPDAVPNRLGAALQHVAEIGPLHALEIQALLEATLGGLGDHFPTMTATLDLLRRLAQDADARVSDPAARTWLETLSRSNKSGRLAGAALDVTGDGAARSVEAAAAVAEAERERAQRWAAGAATIGWR